MEKPPHQEYREELADKLNEIRNSDVENPEIARARAEGYLEAKKESEEYTASQKAHLKDLKNFLPTEPESIIKFIEKSKNEEDRMVSVARLVVNGRQIPQEYIDSTFNYIIENYSKFDVFTKRNIPIFDFLVSTGRNEEIINMYLEAGATENVLWIIDYRDESALRRAESLAEKNGLIDLLIESKKKMYEILKEKDFSIGAKKKGLELAILLESVGRKEEAKKLWLEFNVYYKIIEYALDDNDMDLVMRLYNERFSPEKTIPLLRAYGVDWPVRDGIVFGGEKYEQKIQGLFGGKPSMDIIKLLIRVASTLEKQKDVDEWSKLNEDDIKYKNFYNGQLEKKKKE